MWISAGGLWASMSQLSGKVIDENGSTVAGAVLTLTRGDASSPLMATTDDGGRFHLPSLAPGIYGLRVEKEGFYAYVSQSFSIVEGLNDAEIVLNHRQEFEETVNVVYSVPVIDRQETTETKVLTAQRIVDLPFTSTHDFRNALPLLPGTVKDNEGRIHMNGGDENQAHYVLDGFNITSPVSGILENRIPVDAIRALRLQTSRYSAEFGKGSAGVMSLETAQGDDQWRFSATNFLPSFELQERFQISNWNPRATFSGPIHKGRAWIMNATDLQYDLNVIRELPPEANTNRNWHGSNLTRLQVNLNRNNILTGSFLYNFTDARRFGISPLDPVETSRDVRKRYYFLSVKESAYLGGGWILEAGMALNRLHEREKPQGDEKYVISPEGRSGNYYRYIESDVERIQAIVTALSPKLDWHGSHTFKFGVDGNAIRYRQRTRRRPIEVRRDDGSLSRDVMFRGNSEIGINSAEISLFLQDRWFPLDPLLVEAGLRMDWDRLLGRHLLSPRLALTWGPTELPNSKFSGGIGVSYDAAHLEMLVRAQDQVRQDIFYGEDGTTVSKGPILSRFTADTDALEAPFYLNWSLGYEQKLPADIYLGTSFIRKQGRDGWSYDPILQETPGPQLNTYVLRNSRSDRYYFLEFSLTKTFAEKYPWFLSYARSSATSTAVVDFSLENPVFGSQGGGPLDWDTPHRLISWGNTPAPHFNKITISYFLELRTGLPYQAVDNFLTLVPPPNARRFPNYFSLNLHLERRFQFWRSQWAIRAGFNNITGHSNPSVVIGNIDSQYFGAFAGGQGRVFTGRIRFLGKTKN
jgi:hypothetical protein